MVHPPAISSPRVAESDKAVSNSTLSDTPDSFKRVAKNSVEKCPIGTLTFWMNSFSNSILSL